MQPVTVAVDNDENTPLFIEGVQTTSGLFVRSFPKSIPAHSSATVSLVYVARDGVSSNADVLRLLTDRDERSIVVEYNREKLVSLSSPNLVWAVGETGSKSVELTVVDDATVPKAARAAGRGHATQVLKLRPGVYQITITPASTAEASQFPVFIDFDPLLPGVAATINCYIGLKPSTS